jgi:RNA polymerase sigma-70 factor (ECF subfamily)
MADKEQPDKTPAQNVVCGSALHTCGEEELMRELQSGNGDALSVIFDRYHRLVLVTALRIVHDMGEAEDLMQSVFFEIFQKAAQFDSAKGTLSKWILQYAYHRSINRKSYLTLRQFYNHIDLSVAGGEELWLTKVSLPPQEATRLASESLTLLNDQQREVLELVFFRELTLREIAEQTKQTFGSVRHHYYRGLKLLRDHLSATSKVKGKQAIAPFEKGVRANA